MHATFVISSLTSDSLGLSPLYLYGAVLCFKILPRHTAKPAHLMLILALILYLLEGNLVHLVLIGLFHIWPAQLITRNLHLMPSVASLKIFACYDLPLPVLANMLAMKPDAKLNWPLIALREFKSRVLCRDVGTIVWREFMEMGGDSDVNHRLADDTFLRKLTLTNYLSGAKTQIEFASDTTAKLVRQLKEERKPPSVFERIKSELKE